MNAQQQEWENYLGGEAATFHSEARQFAYDTHSPDKATIVGELQVLNCGANGDRCVTSHLGDLDCWQQLSRRRFGLTGARCLTLPVVPKAPTAILCPVPVVLRTT